MASDAEIEKLAAKMDSLRAMVKDQGMKLKEQE